MRLDEFASTDAQKPGFAGVMDLISEDHRAEAVAGYQSGIAARTIRTWLQSEYPELAARMTPAAVDLWFYKNAPRGKS